MSIYTKLEGIKKLSNSSLTSIVDVTNLNFKDLSKANLDFLNNISYDENLNSFSVFKGTFELAEVTNQLTLKNDGLVTLTIDSNGKIEGQEILVVVSESKRHRFTDFNDWPDVGVPGEIVYTGVQNQKPEFGEDFIGYLDGKGWVSLTSLTSSVGNLTLIVEDGSPINLPNVSNGQGVVWLGPPGYETAYEPSNTTIYFSDDEGNHFDILSNFAWLVSGNDATFRPTGKAIINGAGFQFIDGNQQAGYVLKSDGAGNAFWGPDGGAGGASNFSYWETLSLTADVTQTVTHNLGSNNVVIDFIDTVTNEKVDVHVDNYTANTVDVTATETNASIKIVVVSSGGPEGIPNPLILQETSGTISTANSTLDWGASNNFEYTLTTSTTIAFNNDLDGETISIALIQDGTGGHTVTWPAGVKWGAGGTEPTMTSAGGSTDVYTLIKINGTVYGSYIQDFQ